jgi:DNA-binding Xre family transcriptional regulator
MDEIRLKKNAASRLLSSVFKISVTKHFLATQPRVPCDIILEICHHLESTGDILHFAICSSLTYSLLLPSLFDEIDLRSTSRCLNALRNFQRCPKNLPRIRVLTLRPSHNDWAVGPLKPLDEIWVASQVSQLACHFQNLEEFVWDGQQMPFDELWKTLRMSCPKLRRVGSVVGAADCFSFWRPISDSHVGPFH